MLVLTAVARVGSSLSSHCRESYPSTDESTNEKIESIEWVVSQLRGCSLADRVPPPVQ